MSKISKYVIEMSVWRKDVVVNWTEMFPLLRNYTIVKRTMSLITGERENEPK